MTGMIISKPGIQMSDIVEYYWEMATPILDNGHPIFPRGSLDLIFNIGPSSGYTKIKTDRIIGGQDIAARFSDLERSSSHHQNVSQTWLVGLHDRPLIVRAREREGSFGVHLVSARLTPIAARTLFGIDASETSNRVFEVEDTVGGWIRKYQDDMKSAPTTIDRFAVMERFLLALKARNEKPVSEGMCWISQIGLQRGGRLRVDMLCRHLDVSRKTLAAQMRAQIGFTPKRFLRIMRFRRAVEILGAGQAPSFAMLAHDLGYTDQAHFIRDFNEFAGMSPGQFVQTQ